MIVTNVAVNDTVTTDSLDLKDNQAHNHVNDAENDSDMVKQKFISSR